MNKKSPVFSVGKPQKIAICTGSAPPVPSLSQLRMPASVSWSSVGPLCTDVGFAVAMKLARSTGSGLPPIQPEQLSCGWSSVAGSAIEIAFADRIRNALPSQSHSVPLFFAAIYPTQASPIAKLVYASPAT